MREVEEKAYKEIPLAILKHVAAFCQENGLTYSLHYGTLLGAVRHKGYIPWDDDIDIVMPRNDYEKFRKIYKSERYPLIDLRNDNHYSIGVSKVYDSKTFYYFQNLYKRDIGLFIDVFVLDNIPDDIDVRKKWLRKIDFLKTTNFWKNTEWSCIFKSDNTWMRKVILCLYKLCPISSASIHKKMEKLMTKYNGIDCKCLGCPIDIRQNYFTYAYPKEYFDQIIDLDFEGYRFKSVKQFDNVLKILYGDYMQLPPIEEQKGKHGIIAYYKEEESE